MQKISLGGNRNGNKTGSLPYAWVFWSESPIRYRYTQREHFMSFIFADRIK
jgi:hypothetical protein